MIVLEWFHSILHYLETDYLYEDTVRNYYSDIYFY